MFCCTLLCVRSSIAIILMGKRELVALFNLSSWCLVMVERLFVAVPPGCLRFVIVVFPDHTHLLFLVPFLIFINDLPNGLLITDDCVQYRDIHSLQDCLILQEDITGLGQWGADWKMKFDVAKCHSMRVTQHQYHKQILFDRSLQNQTLENVHLAKYLDITITGNMDWGQHISEISSKAAKTLGFLRRNLTFAPRRSKEAAYKTLVRPKLEYASSVWSTYSKLQINQIEKVQRTAAR